MLFIIESVIFDFRTSVSCIDVQPLTVDFFICTVYSDVKSSIVTFSSSELLIKLSPTIVDL